jgi:hypothetical protein
MKKFIIKNIHTSDILTTLDYDLIIIDDEGKEMSRTTKDNYPKGNFLLELWGGEIVENEKGYKINLDEDHKLWGVKID